MRSAIIIILSSLKANLRQTTSLFIAMLFATLLLIVSINLYFNLGNTFDQAYVEHIAPQVSGMYNPNEVSEDDLINFFETQNIDKLSISQLYDTNYIEANNWRLDMPYVVTMNPNIDKNITPFFKSGIAREPVYGEVVLSEKAAITLGVVTGDFINLHKSNGAVKLKVSDIVIDYLHDSPASTIYRIWINNEQAEEEFPKQTGYYFEGTYKDNIIPDGEKLYSDFLSFIDKEPIGYFYTYEQIKARYTTMLNVTSIIFFSLSIITAIAVIVVLGFAIKGAIVLDCKKIGILQAVGFTRRSILSIYMARYLFIAIIASIIGAIAGNGVTMLLFCKVFSPITISQLPNSMIYLILSIMTMCIISLAILFLSAQKSVKITPINALREQLSEETENTSKSYNKIFNSRFSVCTKLALTKILQRKHQSIMTALSAVLLSTVMMACFSVYTSAANINTQPQEWGLMKMDIFQIPTGDVNSREVLDELKKDPRVAYVYGAHRNTVHVKVDTESQYTQVSIEAYETPLDPNVKLYYYEGRMPESMEEAAVGYGLARNMNIKLGDDLLVNKFGKLINVKVTGIYPTFSDGGNAIQMTTNDIDKFFDNSNLGYYSFVLKEGVNKYTLAENWNQNYEGNFNFLAMQDNAQAMQRLLLPVFLGVILSIAAILSIVMVNTTMLKVNEERRNIGILRTVGLSISDIKRVFLAENLVLASVGALIGVLFGCTAIPVMLSPMMMQFGLSALPYKISILNIILTVLLAIALYIISTLAAIVRIKKLYPKELMKQ